MSVPPVISVLDDDPYVRAAINNLLESRGYTVHTFASADEFLRSTDSTDASCVIADVQMPFMTGIDLLTQMRAQGSATPFIFITAFPDESVRVRALKAGAVCFLGKPFAPTDMMQCLDRALAAGGETRG
ncbi:MULTISPECIES: response regulator transcription factor [Bradyrhizobium]|uniref:response regulator transcription factor n=1 Tax=Bradyrhizobium TaxID=374 RepID=UPI000428F33A|nr:MULTISPECIES: response regulator [Bradyrhizobium]UFW45616.1 response regulator [Bradyrhizobium arachidis]SFU75141.1 Response regulator receiver domain-containing protein [Bradyrhizobium arachidis]